MNLPRKDIHHLVDTLPDRELPAAKRYLQFLQSIGENVVLESLMTAPWDDEPETPEEVGAIREANDDVKSGDVIDNEDLDSLLKE